jgi:hypothetical protein
MRDHSRSSMMAGVASATWWNARRSVLRDEDRVSASRLWSLAPRRREPVSKAVELLWINGVDLELAIKERLDGRTVRNLDRNMNIFRLAAACRDEPIAHLRQPLAAVCEGPFAKPLATGIGKPDVVLLGRPIDAREPTLDFVH